MIHLLEAACSPASSLIRYIPEQRPEPSRYSEYMPAGTTSSTRVSTCISILFGVNLFCDMAAIETPEEIMRYPAGCGAGMRGTSGIFFADAAGGFPIKEGLGSARQYLRIMASL